MMILMKLNGSHQRAHASILNFPPLKLEPLRSKGVRLSSTLICRKLRVQCRTENALPLKTWSRLSEVIIVYLSRSPLCFIILSLFAYFLSRVLLIDMLFTGLAESRLEKSTWQSLRLGGDSRGSLPL